MKFEKVVNLAERRGFFYKSCGIYGGKAGFYDYGSLGTALKRKLENLFRKFFYSLFDNVWEIEPCEIMHENVFRASKHLELFVDPVTECPNGHRFRADKLIEEKLGIKAESLTIEEMNRIFEEGKIVCPECGSKLSKVKLFNLMFPIFVGVESGNLFLYLNELKKIFETQEKYLKKLKEIKYNFETEDGLEFITLLKEVFEKEELYLLEKDFIVYIFNEDFTKVLKYDVLGRKAYFYIKDRDPKEIVEKNIDKYENVDLDKEFEKILDKCKEINTNIDFEELAYNIYKSYKDVLENRMFLRPETAQGPYVNFPKEINFQRARLPLGLFVIGKAFRNEISPRQALLRLREFTQAELQIFFDLEDNPFDKEFEKVKDKKINVLLVEDREKGKDFFEKSLEELERRGYPKFYLYFLYKVQEFYLNVLKIPKERFRFFELSEEERSFYNKYHFDVEVYLDELGWVEVGGIHFRAIELKKEDLDKIKSKKVRKALEKVLENKEKVLVGYDLYNHLILSEDLGFIITKPDGRRILPVELELSFGVDRNIFALLYLAYTEEKVNNEIRIVLKLPEYLAPIEVAVFPLLSNKKELVEKAKEAYELLRKKGFRVYYDDSGSIGKRYRRQDEIGTPYCITIDYQTLEDNTVTIRFRDTMEQIRIDIKELPTKLKELLKPPF